MKRKVVKQGSATYTLSLPATWVKNFGVKEGDMLDVEEIGKELVISPELVKTEKKSEIDVSGFSPSLIKRHILSLYIRGVDEITITFLDPKIAKLIQEMTDSLIGVAVVEQKKNAVIIREVSIPKYEEFDSLLRRIFFTIKSFGDESLEKIEGKDWEGLKEMKHLEHYGTNRLSYFCMRILNKEGYKEFSKTSAIFDIVRFLENIGDEYWAADEYLIETKAKPSNETLEVYKQVNGLIDNIYLVFYKFDREKLDSTYEKVRKIRSEIKSLLSRKPKEETIILYHLRKISELMSYILESIMIISL